MRCFSITVIGLVLFLHLQSFAGGYFTITGNKLQPVIGVTINKRQQEILNNLSPEKASAILSLHIVTDSIASPIPVYGKYSLSGSRLYFSPLYPLGDNLFYEIRYHTGSQTITYRFSTLKEKQHTDTAQVVQVYPIADTIPSNILFFHVRFSLPMANDIAGYTHVTITDEQGNLAERPWRQRTFWLDSGRLMVLMIHPGRVKTGIHYTGPVFVPGKKYTISINNTIKDINGNRIQETVSKQYIAWQEDRTLPKIESFTTTLPAHSCKPLSIIFSKGMDHASITEGIKIFDYRNLPVACIISQSENDHEISIRPVARWQKGRYKIQFESIVSDFASNHINRPFEITTLEEKLKDTIEVNRFFDVR